MCGITGFIHTRPFLTGEVLDRMCDVMSHRGPDDRGAVLWREGAQRTEEPHEPARAGLAQRRLSIIDLSSAGHQPMANEDGSVWISFNGEIYNFETHRRDLLGAHTFRSHTDTETILHLYEEFGLEKTLERLNGMFAFAIYDAPSRKLVLARDRLGKKPLYYLQTPDGGLVFASEIKALLESGLVDTSRINPAGLAHFWTYGYTSGPDTVYSQIHRLPPGHFAVWDNGTFTVREYWDCPFGVDPFPGRTLEDLAEELEALICDALRLRMVSDVPVGLFLSGGIDSSLIAALTAKSVGRDIRSYTIGFSSARYDESASAKAVADHLGLSNTVMRADGDSLSDLLTIAKHFDEPFGDSSAVPTYAVSKLAREHVTVTLTGDGGDELFAGYQLYERALALWGTPEQRALFAEPARTPMKRVSDLWFRHVLRSRMLTVNEMIISPRDLRKLAGPGLRDTLVDPALYAAREAWYPRVRHADVLSRFQYVNLKTYLVDDVLVKVDRMSMAHAQECRSPLLDYRVVEFAARLPFSAKIGPAGETKYLLRHLLKKHLPAHLVDRPKQGFSTPWDEWCQGAFRQKMRTAWQNQKSPWHNPEAVSLLFPEDRPGSKALQWNAFSALCFFEGGL